MTTLGRFIRDKRVAADLTLREVASAVGISAVRLGEIERDKRFPSASERLALIECIPGLCADDSGEVRIALEDQPKRHVTLAERVAKSILGLSQPEQDS